MTCLTVGSLFAGIGGFDLGLERAGMRVIWQSEIDPYASAVLRKHWPDVPNHGDVRSIRAGSVERVDVLCGGFPCQDISNAGLRAGIDGERSGLWSEYARIIGELRPRYVVVENVAALLGRGIERVLGDLAALGFDAEWHCIPASAVGAPHRRDRVWIVAYADGGGCAGKCGCGQVGIAQCGAHVADAGIQGLSLSEREAVFGTRRREEGRATSECGGRLAQSTLGLLADGIPADMVRWSDEPEGVPRVAQGVPNRVDQLRCLGNAIVPQIAEIIGRAIVRAAA